MRKTKERPGFFPCFYASFVIGMIALEIGLILPYLMEEMILSYSRAGGILSAFAIGNLAAGMLNPVLTRKLSARFVTVFFSALLTAALFIMTLLPCYSVLYGTVMLIGVGRGTINIYVYAAASGRKDGQSIFVHLLSVVFAIGALTAPLLTSLLLFFELGWRHIIYVFGFFSIFVPILLLLYHSQGNQKMNEKEAKEQFSERDTEQLEDGGKKGSYYYKQLGFYILGGILFCYIGLENCVNGWFVQYFKDINLMPAAYANMLVSVTWLLILAGRVVTTVISTKIRNQRLICLNCIGAVAFFILMIITKNPIIITFSIGGLGFFCAGIYPACIAGSKRIINNSTAGMSFLLAFSSFGGIIVPQVIGIIADRMGLVSAILYLVIIMLVMVSLALLNNYKHSISR